MLQVKHISILISYDQCMVAEGFKAVLSGHEELHVASIKKNGESLTESILANEIDLLIMEIEDISRDSIQIINKIHTEFPQVKILVISSTPPHELLKPLITIINGYLIRSCSSDKLFLAIHEIFESGKYICSKLISILFKDDEKDNFNIQLTAREKEILFLQFTLKDNCEISKRLHISTTTVRTHLKNIRYKFGDFNQIQMLRYACNKNLHKKQCLPLCPNCRFFCKQ